MVTGDSSPPVGTGGYSHSVTYVTVLLSPCRAPELRMACCPLSYPWLFTFSYLPWLFCWVLQGSW